MLKEFVENGHKFDPEMMKFFEDVRKNLKEEDRGRDLSAAQTRGRRDQNENVAK